MSMARFAIRSALAASLVLAALPLSGCAILEVMMEGIDAYEPPPAESTPSTYYDTDEGALTPEESAGDEAADGVVFDNQNVLAVQNGGTSPTFEVASETVVTKIETYHWNDASGNASTGEISLRGDDGKVYGPWETVGRPGQGDVPNAYWAASPNVTLPAGTYTIVDSDPGTWSQNADSGGEGFALVYGESAQ